MKKLTTEQFSALLQLTLCFLAMILAVLSQVRQENKARMSAAKSTNRMNVKLKQQELKTQLKITKLEQKAQVKQAAAAAKQSARLAKKQAATV